MIKILVKDLYAKQSEILRLKHDIESEFINESAGGGGSTPCGVEGLVVQRCFEKVPYFSFIIIPSYSKLGWS